MALTGQEIRRTLYFDSFYAMTIYRIDLTKKLNKLVKVSKPNPPYETWIDSDIIKLCVTDL